MWTNEKENYLKTVSADCCYCGNKVAMIIQEKYYRSDARGNKIFSEPCFYTGYCPECGHPLIKNDESKITIPTPRGFDNVQHLPKQVEELYNEIRDSYSVRAYTCCVIAGRTLLANIAVEQGAEENRSFVYYVDYMVENFLPKSNSRPWVDKVRQLGNDSAHKYVIAEQERAKVSIKFLEAILKNVYEFPNSIEGE